MQFGGLVLGRTRVGAVAHWTLYSRYLLSEENNKYLYPRTFLFWWKLPPESTTDCSGQNYLYIQKNHLYSLTELPVHSKERNRCIHSKTVFQRCISDLPFTCSQYVLYTHASQKWSSHSLPKFPMTKNAAMKCFSPGYCESI